jgi:hypothetical protein
MLNEGEVLYMQQPGYKSHDAGTRVLRLVVKTLYGLKQFWSTLVSKIIIHFPLTRFQASIS